MATNIQAMADVSKRSIQLHYDLATTFYRLLWGPHIHHGLWESTEEDNPREAQLKLTNHLATLAEIKAGMHVLDIGCGMGGSSIHLAKAYECQVTGITLSPVQAAWARTSSWWKGAGKRTRFLRQDAEEASFPTDSFDVLWSIECTEHLFDKPGFFKRASQWLKPGGKLTICAWLAAEQPRTPQAEELVRQVCEGFLCPSLGTASEYQSWFTDAGLTNLKFEDLTHRVLQTWEICKRRVNKTGVRYLAPIAGQDMNQFIKDFETILKAYREGAMQYGCFLARK